MAGGWNGGGKHLAIRHLTIHGGVLISNILVRVMAMVLFESWTSPGQRVFKVGVIEL